MTDDHYIFHVQHQLLDFFTLATAKSNMPDRDIKHHVVITIWLNMTEKIVKMTVKQTVQSIN